MGGDTSSAYPERLKRYGNVGRGNDQDLLLIGRRLSAALNALSASRPDPAYLPRFEDWGSDLQRFSVRKSQIDLWVAQVGDAFEKAANGGTFDASTMVVTSGANLDKLLAQDPAVQAALQRARQLSGSGWLEPLALGGFLAQLQSLTPEQIDEVTWNLSDQQLAMIDLTVYGPFGQVPVDERNALTNALLANVDQTTMQRLMKDMPDLEPNLMTHYLGKDYSGFNWTWMPSSGPLWGPTGMPDPTSDVKQGDDGDCWFLAGLGAVALTNPDLIKQNIRANSNGTYTVTFYQDGRPVQITVTDDLPYGTKDNSSVTPYAHPSADGADWAQIYEKAYAEFKGGYANIDGGFGNVAIGDITGQGTSKGDVGDYSLQQIQDKLNQGYAITVGTVSGSPPWYEFWKSDVDRVDNGEIVTHHEYYVKSVDLSGQPPTVTLVNPWGDGGGAPQYVTVPESDLHKYFNEISMGQVRTP